MAKKYDEYLLVLDKTSIHNDIVVQDIAKLPNDIAVRDVDLARGGYHQKITTIFGSRLHILISKPKTQSQKFKIKKDFADLLPEILVINSKVVFIFGDNYLARKIYELNKNKGFGQILKLDEHYKPKEYKAYENFVNFISVSNMPNEINHIRYCPGEGDIVFTQNRENVKLIKEISRGGEGVVYESDFRDYVAKIYKSDKNTKWKFEKIKILAQCNIDFKGICAPKILLYNRNYEFVGYLMPKACGHELGKSIFVKPLFEKKLPGWNKKDLVVLCLSILEKIAYLHSKWIILGDINPANILIVSPKEVYFVDVDSYQVSNFPCPVGTLNYTAPEIQGKKYDEFLRSVGNENFAIVTLLFMIMLPGRSPYAQIGGESPKENIKNMNFPYKFGKNKTDNVPNGLWENMWSMLTYKLKEAFWHSFSSKGQFCHETTRLSVSEWISIFTSYLENIENGALVENDKNALEIYPTNIKGHDKFKIYQTRTCRDCGKSFAITQNEFEFYQKKGYHLPVRCSICRKVYKNDENKTVQVYQNRTCKDCGKSFAITQSEYEFYISKNFNLPIRCKKCRKNKKHY